MPQSAQTEIHCLEINSCSLSVKSVTTMSHTYNHVFRNLNKFPTNFQVQAMKKCLSGKISSQIRVIHYTYFWAMSLLD